jgi:hypothetical protein
VEADQCPYLEVGPKVATEREVKAMPKLKAVLAFRAEGTEASRSAAGRRHVSITDWSAPETIVNYE